MKTKANLILAGIFFGLLAAYLGLEYSGVKARRRYPGMAIPAIVELETTAIRAVEIGGGKTTVRMERIDARTWRIVKPMVALADSNRVENLVTTLQTLRTVPGVDPLKGPPSEYGLAPAERTITLFDAANRALAVIEIGKRDEERRFVRDKEKGVIELVDARTIASADLALADWREHSIFQASSFAIKKLRIKGPGRDLGAERELDAWRLTSPIRAVADAQKLEGIAADIAALKVAGGDRGFLADDLADPAKYGLDKPRMTIEVDLGDEEKPRVVEIGGEKPSSEGIAYARRLGESEVFLIDFGKLADFGLRSDQLRSKRIANLTPQLVNFIDIVQGDREIALERGAGGWSIIVPSSANADGPAVRLFLDKLTELQASQFLKPAEVPKSGLDPPAYRIRVWQRKPAKKGDDNPSDARESTDGPRRIVIPTAPPQLSLNLGARDTLKKTIWGQTDGDPMIAAIPDALMDVLPTSSLSFRDRSLRADDPRRIDRAVVTQGKQKVVIEAPSVAGTRVAWMLAAPVSAIGDPGNIPRLVSTLAMLRAERLIADHPADLKAFGLLPPEMSVNWRIKAMPGESSENQTDNEPALIIGKEATGHPGERYAMVSGADTLFTLGPTTMAILTAELKDRKLMAIDPGQITHLTLQWPAKALKLSRLVTSTGIAGDWSADADSGYASFDPIRIQRLSQGFANVIAAKYAQYDGAYSAETGLASPRLVIELRLRGDAKPHILKLGKSEPGGMIYATTAESDRSGFVAFLPGANWLEWMVPPDKAAPSGLEPRDRDQPELPANVFSPDEKAAPR